MGLHSVFLLDSPLLKLFGPSDLLFDIFIDHWMDILLFVSKSLFVFLNDVFQMMNFNKIFLVFSGQDIVNAG